MSYTGKYLLESLKGPRILEMGCADGAMTSLLAEFFPDVTAVDGSAELIAKARKKAGDRKNLTFVNAMFEEIDLEPNFDTVLQAHILEHVENPVEVLSIGRRLLAPGGLLVAQVPNANSVHRMIGVKMGIIETVTSLSGQDLKLGHRRVYTMQNLKKDAESAGLTVVNEGGYFLKPLSNSQMESWDNRLLDAFFELGRALPDIAAEIYVVCKKA